MDRLMDKLMDRLLDKLMDRLMHRLMDKLMYRLMQRLINDLYIEKIIVVDELIKKNLSELYYVSIKCKKYLFC